MTTALATTNQATLAFEPAGIGEAYDTASKLVKSGMLPDSIRSPEAALAVIMAGRELGLTAMQSFRSIHIVKGRVVLSADLMVALCKRSPDCEYVQIVESTDKVATYEAKRRNEPAPVRMSFTFDQAKAAGLTGKDVWRSFTAAMLRARCAAAICRAVFPDLLLGVYETDEAQHFTKTRPVSDPARPQVVAEYETLAIVTPEGSVDVAQYAAEAAQIVANETSQPASDEAPALPPIAINIGAQIEQAEDEQKVDALMDESRAAYKAGLITVEHGKYIGTIANARKRALRGEVAA